MTAFIQQNGEPAVQKRQNGDFGAEFVYPKDVAKFRAFHDKVAVLQIVSRDVHQRCRHAQLSAIAAEGTDAAQVAKDDLVREFPDGSEPF